MNAPVIGWGCSYVPEEIILAAECHSSRLISDYNNIELAEAFIPSNVCPYTRNVFESTLNGDHDFLSGVIFTNSCQACEFLYDNMKACSTIKFCYMLDVPRRADEHGLAFFRDRLDHLIRAIETHFRVNIGEEELKQAAIELNDNRRRLLHINETRKTLNSPLTGTEFTALVNIANDMPPMEYSRYLAQYEQSLGEKLGKDGKRILLMGSKLSHAYLPDLIESENALIVYEDMCSHHRSFDGLVDTGEEDILNAIARRYLMKMPCPRMVDTSRHMLHLVRIIEEYNIDGIIYHSLKFCASHTIKATEIRDRMKAQGVPFLFIEGDYSFTSFEQIRNRIGTFLEII